MHKCLYWLLFYYLDKKSHLETLFYERDRFPLKTFGRSNFYGLPGNLIINALSWPVWISALLMRKNREMAK